jgi:hypothetical protein
MTRLPPQKTKSPSGAAVGGIPPKNGPIFSQKTSLQMRQVRLDPDFGRIHAGCKRPKGEDAQVGDSPHLQ